MHAYQPEASVFDNLVVRPNNCLSFSFTQFTLCFFLHRKQIEFLSCYLTEFDHRIFGVYSPQNSLNTVTLLYVRSGADSECSICQSTNDGFLPNIYFIEIFIKIICVREEN